MKEARKNDTAKDLMSKTTKKSDIAEDRVIAHLQDKYPEASIRKMEGWQEQQVGDVRFQLGANTTHIEVKTTGAVANTGAIVVEEVQNEWKSTQKGWPDGWINTGKYEHMLWYCPNNSVDIMYKFQELKDWYKKNKQNYELRTGNRTGTTSHYRKVPLADLKANLKSYQEIKIKGREEDAEEWAEWASNGKFYKDVKTPEGQRFDVTAGFAVAL